MEQTTIIATLVLLGSTMAACDAEHDFETEEFLDTEQAPIDNELGAEHPSQTDPDQGESVNSGPMVPRVGDPLDHLTHHNYTQSSDRYVLVPWNSTSEYRDTAWSSADVGYYYHWTVAPYDGTLETVWVRSSNTWSGANSSAVRLYVMTEGSTTNTGRGSWVYHNTSSANYTREYDMNSASFNAGERIGIVVWTSSGDNHGDVQVTALWEYDTSLPM